MTTTSFNPSSMAIRRSARGRGLPENLYYHAASGLYRYCRPDDKTWHYMGRDRTKAVQAANKLNGLLIPAEDAVDQVMRHGIPTLPKAIALFRENEFPAMDLAEKTRSDYAGIFRRLEAAAPTTYIDDVTVKHCVETLRGTTSGERAYMQARNLLSQVFRYAMAEGWCEANYAEMTRRLKVERKRSRLTLEGFQAVRKVAPAWFQCAMDVALQTLQRREDLSVMRWPERGILRVQQIKTGERIEIAVGSELEAAISACRDSVVSPFIIHRAPEKARPADMRAGKRLHFSQVLPEQLSRAFQDAREVSGFYADDPNPPTFHEMRSLGMDLYRRAGWTDEQIQALAGHEDVAMTRHYLDGHEPPWNRVSAGLKIA